MTMPGGARAAGSRAGTLGGGRAAESPADAAERPLWDPDWSNPTTARRLSLVALVASGAVVLWQRRRHRTA
jgi:hypothetical protein